MDFTNLYHEHFDLIYGLAMKKVVDPDLAEEITQATFVRAWEKLDQLDDPSKFGTWAATICVRFCVDHFRQPVMLPLEDEEDRAIEQVQVEPDVSDILKAGLDQLRPVHREILEDFYLLSKTIKEISRDKAVPLGTVKRRLCVGRHKLRKKLKRLQ